MTSVRAARRPTLSVRWTAPESRHAVERQTTFLELLAYECTKGVGFHRSLTGSAVPHARFTTVSTFRERLPVTLWCRRRKAYHVAEQRARIYSLDTMEVLPITRRLSRSHEAGSVVACARLHLALRVDALRRRDPGESGRFGMTHTPGEAGHGLIQFRHGCFQIWDHERRAAQASEARDGSRNTPPAHSTEITRRTPAA
jgi:hypothetical protein